MKRLIEKNKRRVKRKMRIRGRLAGTPERPRVSVFRSNKHLYAQVIDDANGKTVASISNQKDHAELKVTVEDAAKLGEALGSKMMELKIAQAVFDRNGFLYHGVVKAFADGVRKAGITL